MRSRSPAKVVNPSREVEIVPARGSDGGETWDVVIASKVIQKLAKAAGVSEAELSWLNQAVKDMMFDLLAAESEWAPTWTKRIEHLRAILSAAGKLETLLGPKWVAADMRHFESKELKREIFGTQGFANLKTKADGQKFKKWSRTGSQLLEAVMRDVEAVTRIRARLSAMINQLGDGTLARGRDRLPPPAAASNPVKQDIADCALTLWTRLGHSEERTDPFIAFADVLYQLAGFAMSPDAIRAQLTSAVKRDRAKAAE